MIHIWKNWLLENIFSLSNSLAWWLMDSAIGCSFQKNITVLLKLNARHIWPYCLNNFHGQAYCTLLYTTFPWNRCLFSCQRRGHITCYWKNSVTRFLNRDRHNDTKDSILKILVCFFENYWSTTLKKILTEFTSNWQEGYILSFHHE